MCWIRFFVTVLSLNAMCVVTQKISSEEAKESLVKKSKVYHIAPHELDEMEDAAYSYFIKNTIEKAEEDKADLLIVEIDTPGGQLAATLKIEKTIRASSIPSVCFVNRNAISAGSLIALSCNKLVMAKGSRMGAATPVTMSSKGMKKAPEKILSAGRAIWRSAAQAQNKNPDIAEAFVDENVVLTKKKHGIDKPKGKLLTLTTKEALKLRMINYISNDVYDIVKKEKIENFSFTTFSFEFKERVIKFFLHPVISGIFLTLGFLGLFYELKTPGWGIPGAAGLVFLSAYFVPHILVGQSGWGAPALLALGILFMVLEIFVIPGFGISGIFGLILIIASTLWAYGISNLTEGLWVTSIALTMAFFMIMLSLKYLPNLNLKGNQLFLSESLNRGKEIKSVPLKHLIGREGITASILRPSGTVIIDNNPFDALAQGEFIEAQTKVCVVKITGSQVIVKRV